ncbi:DUF814-domain-containing protein [Trichocladium antarcticum]|uniref:Ribosome quality control complex subunit 2 n=1 Tax=Trichocladium antarcticum TaxID=1450529 RepID=A0AAN6UQL1_9PEZI|nr:DUF814-domain-containing protein [Trichocladium antarcticum]
MKQRFSSLDVKVIAHELAEALIILLKFAKPDTKQQLLIESGFRCHLTDFARTAAPAPSAFVARLRKFLKTRRLTRVSQIGTDRIIEFQFSDGAYRLYLEFFASGNIILTDADLKILALLRIVPEGEGQEPQRVGSTYTLENRQNHGGIPALTKQRLRDALKTASEQAVTKKAKRKGSDELRRGLATTITELPPILVDHVFRLTDFDPATKPLEALENETLLDALFRSLEQARTILDNVTSSSIAKGYIIAKPNPRALGQAAGGDEPQNDKSRNLLYEDFQPFLPKQFEDDPNCQILPFEGYNKTVDKFFSSLEGQKLESRLQEREATATRKLDAARQDQARRIEGLQETQSLNLRKAAAIEANVERVQEVMDAINGLVQQGMDWVDINKLVEREQKQNNPVAEIIKLPMKLDESIITLLLGEEEEEAEVEENDDFDYDSDEEAADNAEADKAKGPDKRLAIDINLKISPWNNATEYYEQKRTAASKQEKTAKQSEMALKSAEQKIAEDLKKGLKQEKPVLQPIRRQMWFEKFTWFISSDGYLVLGGRDAQQNEILYKRYLKKGDVYVHADMHGASTVIIKNHPRTPDAPIPPSTLAQAGNLSVCCSSAWDSKAAMGAWWVNADQVSKSAPAGEFLPVGSFMVRGKRNFLPPALLTLGFGLLFRVSDESKAKHMKHRLYDAADVSTTGAASATPVGMETPREDVGGESESSDDEGQDDDEERANPLQSNTAAEAEAEPEPQPEPPSEALSRLDVDEQTPTVAEPAQSPPPSTRPDTPSTRPDTPSQTSQKTQPAPPKRGQRGKAKKIATKYKHQDDEDRTLMEQLLGVAAARDKAEAEAAAKAEREAAAAAAAARRKQAQDRMKKQIAEHEAVRAKAMLDGGDGDGDGDGDDGGVGEDMDGAGIDSLVGTPLPGDEILAVVPVCAPWSALGRVKYKARLQPGQVKKGKAVKEIVERWRIAANAGAGAGAGGRKARAVVDERAEDVERMWPREMELIKGLKAEEAINVVPVGKVAGPGGGKGGGSGKGGGRGKGGKKK